MIDINTYGFILILCMIVSAIFLGSSYRKKTLGYRLLTIVCFLFVLLFLGESYELFSIAMPNRLIGAAIAQIPYSFIVVVVFAFVLYVGGKKKFIKSKYMILITIIPIIEVICTFINCFIPICFTLTVLPTGFIQYNATLLYFCLDCYVFILSFISIIMLIFQIHKNKDNSVPLILFLAAVFVPTFVSMVSFNRFFIPLSFFISLVFFYLAVFKYDLIDSSVIHKEFIDSANMGLLFFNEKKELVEYNPFSEPILKLKKEYVGKVGDEIFKDYPEFLDFFNSEAEEIKILSTTGTWFKINKSKVYKDSTLIGYLFIFEDITKETVKTQNLEVMNEVMADVENSNLLAINYCDKDGNYYWSDVAYQILERDPRPEDIHKDIFEERIIETRFGDVNEVINQLKEGDIKVGDFKIRTESGKIKFITGTLHKIFDNNGDLIRLSMSAQDVSEKASAQIKLIKSNQEKSVLIKEIHHRVKNNLQLMSSFINLEEKLHADDPARIISITRARIDSLALIHERIYTENHMDYITVIELFEDFDNNLSIFTPQKDIKFIREIPKDLTLDVNILTPLTLMVNELTTNSFKYAFDDTMDDKTIYKSLNLFEKDGKTFARFMYKDNGNGLPEGFDIKTTKSLGWKIIISLSNQLDGEYELINDNGLGFVLTFPIIN